MTLADSNVWLALAISEHPFHEAARHWLDGMTQAGDILFCRSTQQSVLRLLTTAAVLRPYGSPPLTNQEAWDVYEGFLADPRIVFQEEPTGLFSIWKSLTMRETASPKLWMDAYLAAFAIAGGHQLVTIDTAFRQHAQLDLVLLSNT